MPGFTLLNYNNSVAGVNDSNVSMTAAVDQEFPQDGSGNYRFSEDYQLLGVALVGASVTKGRFQVPHWNALAEFDIFAANRSLKFPANPFIDWYRPRTIPIPKFESFKVQESNNLGASTEIENCLLWIMAADGLWPLPSSGIPFKTIATLATFTPTINAWSAPQPLVLAQALRGGVYAVIGAVFQGDHTVAARLIFPRYRMYNGRKLRPGTLVQNAVGNAPSFQLQREAGILGEWGRFWTQEPPQVEVFATAATNPAMTIFLDLIYLGEDQSLAYQGSGGGAAGYSGSAAMGLPGAA